MIVSKNIRARAQEYQHDEKGRWVWIKIYGKRQPVLIVQLYVPGAINGITSTYAQQVQQLQQEKQQSNPDVINTSMKTYVNSSVVIKTPSISFWEISTKFQKRHQSRTYRTDTT